MSELLILRLRNKIADKETIIACANMELSKGGWTCAWDHELQRVNIEIDEILNKLEGTKS